MAWDSSDADYHLTPRGWQTGSPPDDRVETWNRSMHQASGWSKEHVAWTCMWVAPDIPRPDRDALREKYRDFMGVSGRSGDRVTTLGEPL